MKAGEFYPIKEQGWEFCQINSSRPISFMSLGRGYTDPDAAHRWNDWGSYIAGDLTSPIVVVGLLQILVYGIDLYPSPSEGAVNDTMVHAVEPGRSTMFKVSVKDIGIYPENVALTIGKVPTGWNVTLDRPKISLSSCQVTEVLLTVTVPNNTHKDTRVNISIRGDTLRKPGKSRNDTAWPRSAATSLVVPDT
jgi:hypothetical protein